MFVSPGPYAKENLHRFAAKNLAPIYFMLLINIHVFDEGYAINGASLELTLHL